MSTTARTAGNFDIFLVAIPGLEGPLCAEARALGFKAKTTAGGVTLKGGWPDVWRANLELRGASRILARIGAFRVHHLAQLDKRARQLPWSDLLRSDVPVHVEATCKASRIYHSGAAAERIERAICETVGVTISPDAPVTIMARIDDDLCTLSVDTSGDLLHKRGHKEAVAKAPMRETMAALFLRQCGYDGSEPIIDPMCGSGTFVIEAAEIAAGLKPGRSRHFAFEQLATFDKAAWQGMLAAATSVTPSNRFYGSDQDAGAIRMSRANALRAQVDAFTTFENVAIDDLVAPDGPPGLIMVNPPYGDRMGDARTLEPLYRSLGDVLARRFSGWRVGLITANPKLADATGLAFILPAPPVAHGGLRVTLYRTGPLS